MLNAKNHSDMSSYAQSKAEARERAAQIKNERADKDAAGFTGQPQLSTRYVPFTAFF